MPDPTSALSPALAGVSLGRNPNGAVNETVRSVKEKLASRKARAEGDVTEVEPDWDRLGLDEPLTVAERDRIDRELALDEEVLYGAARS